MSETSSLFDKQKSDCFSKIDLSRKGSIDEPILKIIETLNTHKNYFSLSSCSGRIVVLREGGSPIDAHQDEASNELTSSVVKAGCAWIHVDHEVVDVDKVLQLIQQHTESQITKGCVVIKFEPLVLHIQCRSTEHAKLLHTVAIEAGFRNSGITLGKSGKVVSAVRSTHALEVPVSDDSGKLLVSPDYIKFILRKSNTKLEENFRRIALFEQKLIEYLSKSGEKPKQKKVNKPRRVKEKIVDHNSENGGDSDFIEIDFLNLDQE